MFAKRPRFLPRPGPPAWWHQSRPTNALLAVIVDTGHIAAGVFLPAQERVRLFPGSGAATLPPVSSARTAGQAEGPGAPTSARATSLARFRRESSGENQPARPTDSGRR